MGQLQSLLEKYHMEKWFRRENLVVLVLGGILLVVIAMPIKEPEKESQAVEEHDTVVLQEKQEGDYEKWYAYATHLEEELEEILVKVKGVGEVSVMITLDASEEVIIQKDETIIRNETQEQDSAGGTRIVTGSDLREETIYQKTEGEEIPYITKTKLPEISGVLVVAKGAGNAMVKKRITEIAEALFSVEAHKITVVEMN